jgi:uncharacterized protein (TIGR03083 family)
MTDLIAPGPAFLPYLTADAERLATAAEQAGPGTLVPTCPGWTVEALVAHTGAVYAHKVAALRLGRAPRPDEVNTPDDDAPLLTLLGYYRRQLDLLVAELDGRDPAEPTWTWFELDGSTGFWFRRMAHETAVHRIDAEAALDRYTPVDELLAADGVNELLMFATDPDIPAEVGAGRAGHVEVVSGATTWHVTLSDDTQMTVDAESGAAADATVTGSPVAGYLWLWGRTDAAERLGGVVTRGDAAVLERLRAYLTAAAQ